MNRVGWYGKVPCQGDFLNKHVDVQFTHPWDHWLQKSITALRAKFNGHADEVLLTFPIWRFFIRAGTFDQYHWVGVFTPSADRVNRIFPFTVVTRLEPNAIDTLSLSSLQSWLNAAQTAVENLISKDDLAAFEQSIDSLPSLSSNQFTSFEDQFGTLGFSQKVNSANFSSLWWTQLSVVHEASMIDQESPDTTQRLKNDSPNFVPNDSNTLGRFEFCEWSGPLQENLFERLMAL
jgi:type VI secretion system ImpM family protein